MLMIRYNLGDIRALCRRRGSIILVWRPWYIMTLIRVQVRTLRRWTIIRHRIFSLKLLVFIFFVDSFLFNSMLSYTMRSCRLPLLLRVFSNWLMIPLRCRDCRRLTLVHSRPFWGHALPVFLIRCMSCVHYFYRSFIIIVSLRIVLSEIRTDANRFIIRLPCLLASSILGMKRWLLRLCSPTFVGSRRQRTWLISVCSILSLVILARLLILALDLRQHVASIVSFPAAVFLLLPFLCHLGAFIAWLGQSIS